MEFNGLSKNINNINIPELKLRGPCLYELQASVGGLY